MSSRSPPPRKGLAAGSTSPSPSASASAGGTTGTGGVGRGKRGSAGGVEIPLEVGVILSAFGLPIATEGKRKGNRGARTEPMFSTVIDEGEGEDSVATSAANIGRVLLLPEGTAYLSCGEGLLECLHWIFSEGRKDERKPNQSFGNAGAAAGLVDPSQKQKTWGAVSALIASHLGWVIPQQRRELLQLGDIHSIVELLLQIEEQVGLAAKLPPIHLLPPPRSKPVLKEQKQQGSTGTSTQGQGDGTLPRGVQGASRDDGNGSTPPPPSTGTAAGTSYTLPTKRRKDPTPIFHPKRKVKPSETPTAKASKEGSVSPAHWQELMVFQQKQQELLLAQHRDITGLTEQLRVQQQQQSQLQAQPLAFSGTEHDAKPYLSLQGTFVGGAASLTPFQQGLSPPEPHLPNPPETATFQHTLSPSEAQHLSPLPQGGAAKHVSAPGPTTTPATDNPAAVGSMSFSLEPHCKPKTTKRQTPETPVPVPVRAEAEEHHLPPTAPVVEPVDEAELQAQFDALPSPVLRSKTGKSTGIGGGKKKGTTGGATLYALPKAKHLPPSFRRTNPATTNTGPAVVSNVSGLGGGVTNMEEAVRLRMKLRAREDEAKKQVRDEEKRIGELARQTEGGGAASEKDGGRKKFTLLQAAVWTQAALRARQTATLWHARRLRYRAIILLQCFIRFRQVVHRQRPGQREEPTTVGLGCVNRCRFVLNALEQRVAAKPTLQRRKVRHFERWLCPRCRQYVDEVLLHAAM